MRDIGPRSVFYKIYGEFPVVQEGRRPRGRALAGQGVEGDTKFVRPPVFDPRALQPFGSSTRLTARGEVGSPMSTPVTFSAEHLREFATVLARVKHLEEGMGQGVGPGTMLAVMLDEADQTTSAGVFLQHTAFTTEGGFMHYFSVVGVTKNHSREEIMALAKLARRMLGLEDAPLRKGSSARSAMFCAEISSETQAAFNDAEVVVPSDQVLSALLTELEASQKPWWRFW